MNRVRTTNDFQPLNPLTNKNDMKKLTCSYLYADNHAVLVYEKQDKDAGTINFVEIHEHWTDAKLSFTGRLIFGQFDQEMMKLAKRANSIQAHEASTSRGSENTKKMGIAYGSLEFRMSSNYWGNALHFHELPGLISGSYTYQPKVEEKCPAATEMFWGNYRVAKFHAKQATPTQAAA